MREFIYYSRNAVTDGNFIKDDLMQAGRMDIVCNVIINAFFTSHNVRDDVKLHLIFGGAPDHPKHIEIEPHKIAIGSKNNIDIAPGDIAKIIKKILRAYEKGKRIEALPNIFIEKKGLRDVIEEIGQDKIVLLDKKGKEIRNTKNIENAIFLIGDHDGFPKYEERWMKKSGIRKISLGKKMYYATQSIIILQNELDIRE